MCVFVLRVRVQRVGTFLCVLFEFPLLERPFRLTSLQLLGIDVEPGTQQWTASAAASVTLLCGVAALNVPLDLISALSGSTGGALLIYVAPALMAIRLIQSGGASAGAAGAAESAPARVALLWTLAAVNASILIRDLFRLEYDGPGAQLSGCVLSSDPAIASNNRFV